MTQSCKTPQRLLVQCLVAASLFFGSQSIAVGQEVPHLRYSVRALGMGNAFIATANDEFSLYYNPAGLESVRHYSFEFFNVGGTINQNLIDLGNASGTDSTALLGQITGNKIYFEGSLSALSFTAPGWGWSLFTSGVMDGTIHNPVVPYVTTNAYVQAGGLFGLSMNFADALLDIGVVLKQINRAGIGTSLHIVDFLDPNLEQSLRDQMISGAPQKSIDIGATYHLEDSFMFQTKASAVLHNIGGLDFGSTGQIPTTLDFGIASESEFFGVDVILAADLVDATFKTTETKSIRRNINLGVELGLLMRSNGHNMISYRMGMKGPYPTSGWTINPPYIPIMIDYAQWSEEIGSYAGSVRDRRQTVQFAINF